ncbi:M13 family metallopeptidase [Companilactobacillus mishanensis]|uniref:M13 family metallopeptidase n=1 Tax=Companilactobacillus mishanensis TaxID=2486008 RepID=UPI0012951B20|nr:M13 family metallopeptidase [Companilactobacillus mishanensis]MQS89249.1 M13 family metallopeptidase [Companilactobacillus mishanensis]
MKNKGGILICTTVLTILLGMSVVTENAKADTVETADQSVQSEQTTSTTPNAPVTNPVTTDQQKSNPVDDALTVPTPEVDQQPGGNWNIYPSSATPQDNYFYYVNQDWLLKHANDQGTDNYSIMENNTDNDLEKDLSDISLDNKSADSATKQAADYYQKYLTTLNSQKPDIQSFKKDIQEIDSMKNYSDLNSHMEELINGNLNTPFLITAEPVLTNNLKNRLTFSVTSATNKLPTLGSDDEAIATRDLYYENMPKLFRMLGFDEVKTKEILDSALTFADLISRNSDSSLVDKDPGYKQNIVSISDFENHFSNVDFIQYISNSFPSATDIRIDDPTFYDNYNNILSKPNFEKMKDWMLVSDVLDNYYVFGKTGKDAVQNLVQEASDTNGGQALDATSDGFRTILSKYYAENNLNGKTTNRIESLVDNIISAYKDNIQDNSWLSNSGKPQVLNKLSKINVKIGGPTEIKGVDDFSSIKFSKDASIYDWDKQIDQYIGQSVEKDFTTTNEKGMWTMASYKANANYNPTENSITIPAGLLQDPIYLESDSDSQIYGSIGAIIGHELSHAFDNNGSKYDENGNYRDTWTVADRDKFNELTQKMVDEYNGIKFDYLVENGQQTLGENIADNGGLNVALQVAKSLSDFDAKEFFSAYAANSRMIPGYYVESDYATDEHTIGPIRVNVALQNIDDFYTTYNIKPGDAMWLDPSKRVHIW